MDTVSDMSKTSTLAFRRTLFKGDISNFADCNLAQGLVIHNRTDDLDLISRSKVCQVHKLQVVIWFFPL